MVKLVNIEPLVKAMQEISENKFKDFSTYEVDLIKEVIKEFFSVYINYSKDPRKFDMNAFDMGLYFVTHYGKLSFMVDQIDNTMLKTILAEFIFGYINALTTEED